MPEYDPTNPPKPMADDLTRAEVGRDMVIPGSSTGTTGQQPTVWPSSNLVPEEYAGPVPSREFEVSGLGRSRAASQRALAPDPDPSPSQVQPSIAPPPGHEAQP